MAKSYKKPNITRSWLYQCPPIEDFFEGRDGGCLVRVCGDGHGELDDDVLAFVGIVVVMDSAIGGAAGLELDVVSASSVFLFEEGTDDAGERLEMFG